MVEIIIAFLTGILGPILILFVKSKLNNTSSKPDPLSEAVYNADIVSNELDELLIDAGADRVWIAQFHNGGHYYPTGKSIQKFSFFFESVRAMKDSIKLNFQNIPVNLFSKAFVQILNSNIISIPDYKDQTTATYGLKYIAEETGTKSSYLFSIRTVEDKLIGVLGIEYTNRKKILTQEELIKFRVIAASLGGILINHLTKN